MDILISVLVNVYFHVLYVYVAVHMFSLRLFNNIVSLMALCEDGENDPGQMTQ